MKPAHQTPTMVPFERMKTFKSTDPEELELTYNNWIIEQSRERAEHPVLKGHPFVVKDRQAATRLYDGEETFVLMVFYDHFWTAPQVKGPDRGQSVNGVSMFAAEKKRGR